MNASLNMQNLCACFLLISAATLFAGCDLLGKSGPEEARLTVQVSAGQEIRMITSSRFLTSRIQEIEENGSITDSLSILLLDSDTFFVNNAFDSTYNIRFEQQFYVRLIRSSPGGDNLNARLWIDDELKFENQSTDLRDSLQFVYNFSGPPGQENIEL